MICKLQGQKDKGGHYDVRMDAKRVNKGGHYVQMKRWMQKGGIMKFKLKRWMDKGGHNHVQIKRWIRNGALKCASLKG